MPRLRMGLALGFALALLWTEDSLGQIPSFGNPTFLSGDGLIGPAAGVQETPVLARGDGTFLAVWSDLRTDFYSLGITTAHQSGFDLYAARIDAAGNLLDPTPIVLSQNFGQQEKPLVAWNGQNWLVVWQNQSPTQFYYASEILAVRVAGDGTVLDDTPISVVAFQNSTTALFDLTSNGTDWMVVTEGTSVGETGLYGRRISAAGTLLDPSGVLLVPDTFFLYFNLKLSSAGGEYLLVYEASGQYLARRFQPDLTQIGVEFDIPRNFIGTNGQEYFVFWNSGGSVVGSPMSVDGILQFPSGVPIAPSSSFQPSLGVNVIWDGMDWWASWHDALSGVMFARITAAGTVLDPGGIPYDTSLRNVMRHHVIAGADSGGVEMVWYDTRLGGFNAGDIFSAPISANVVPGVEVPIAVGAPSQRFPDVSEGQNNYMAVFTTEVSGQRRVVAQRVDAAGISLDLEPIELDSGPGLGSPRVAWNGSLFLVVWSDAGVIYGSRILPDGTLLDPTPLVIMNGSSPDAAALDDVFFVVGTQPTISSQFVHPFGIRIQGSTGTILDPAPILLGQYFARYPRVERFDNRWIASWQRNVSHDDPTAYIKYVLVEPDGVATSEFQVTVGGQPDIACSDNQALLVWKSGTDSSSDPNIMATRLLPDGTQLDGNGFAVCNLPDKQIHPDVLWTGSEYLVAWEDMRNAVVFFDERTDVYGARVNTDGSLVDPAGFPLSDTETPSERPAFARLGDQILFAASLFQSEFPYAAYRIGVGLNISVTTVEIIDNGDPGYTTATAGGVWNTFGAGFQGDINWTEPGQGDTATWAFIVTPGSTQRVSATWFNHPTLATDAPFEIFDGATSLGVFNVNQQVAPSGFPDAGATWDDLTAGVMITSGILTVELSDLANGRVAADAIRIEEVDPSIQIIDNGDPGYTTATAGGVWNTFGAGFQSDIDWTEPGQGDTATWTFTVTPGDYQVSATWFNHPTLATDAPFEVFDGATSVGVFNVNQQVAPSQFSEAGANWDDLAASVNISSGTLTVQLSDLANGRVAADAIRIAAASPAR